MVTTDEFEAISIRALLSNEQREEKGVATIAQDICALLARVHDLEEQRDTAMDLAFVDLEDALPIPWKDVAVLRGDKIEELAREITSLKLAICVPAGEA